MRRISSIMTLILVACLLTIGGVSASWIYATGTPNSITIPIVLNPDWSGVELLPDGFGANHVALINNVSRELSNSNSALSQAVKSRFNPAWYEGSAKDTFGSTAVTGGGNLASLGVDENGESTNIYTLIYHYSDTEYHVFTVSTPDGTLGTRGECNTNWIGTPTGNKTPGQPFVGIGTYIENVYMTILVKDGDTWSATKTEVGYAKSDWYLENGGNRYTEIPSLDPESWKTTLDGGDISESVFD